MQLFCQSLLTDFVHFFRFLYKIKFITYPPIRKEGAVDIQNKKSPVPLVWGRVIEDQRF